MFFNKLIRLGVACEVFLLSRLVWALRYFAPCPSNGALVVYFAGECACLSRHPAAIQRFRKWKIFDYHPNLLYIRKVGRSRTSAAYTAFRDGMPGFRVLDLRHLAGRSLADGVDLHLSICSRHHPRNLHDLRQEATQRIGLSRAFYSTHIFRRRI